mmetsp:Transcript_77119/g.221593  ORF Transcript_77119/g.221593 Transcript_77119/m.221593 type:complete len:679 (+) Transcript_77119:187-2223(+)
MLLSDAHFACPDWMREEQPGERWTVPPSKIERVLKRLTQLHSSVAIRRLAIGGEIHHTVARFLAARGNNETKAFQMLDNSLKWRLHFGSDINNSSITVDDVISFTIENQKTVRRCHPHGWQGYDREGRLVYMVRAGLSDSASLLREIEPDDVLLCHVQAMEFQNNVLLRPESLTPGTPPDRRRLNGITILCDLTGLGLHNLTPSVYKIVQMIAKIDQDNYPENLAKMYIINAPVMFNMVWKVVRKFLERETKQKIMVFSGPDQHIPKLLDALDFDTIPKCIGGRAQKDDEYWSGGYSKGEQHSSHIAMDEYIEHHARFTGHTRIASPLSGTSLDRREFYAARSEARQRASVVESNVAPIGTVAVAPQFTALAGAPAFRPLRLGKNSWFVFIFDLIWPLAVSMPYPALVALLQLSRRVKSVFFGMGGPLFGLLLGVTASLMTLKLGNWTFTKLRLSCAAQKLDITLWQSSVWRALLYVLVLVPTWQCVAIVVLGSQHLCNHASAFGMFGGGSLGEGEGEGGGGGDTLDQASVVGGPTDAGVETTVMEAVIDVDGLAENDEAYDEAVATIAATAAGVASTVATAATTAATTASTSVAASVSVMPAWGFGEQEQLCTEGFVLTVLGESNCRRAFRVAAAALTAADKLGMAVSEEIASPNSMEEDDGSCWKFTAVSGVFVCR